MFTKTAKLEILNQKFFVQIFFSNFSTFDVFIQIFVQIFNLQGF
jgi:hypothetical protein